MNTQIGREKNGRWNTLSLDEQIDYNRSMSETFKTLDLLIEKTHMPYSVLVALKQAESKKEFPIDFDRSVVVITTDQLGEEGFKTNAGILVVGIENGLVKLLETMEFWLRRQNRFHYIKNLQSIKRNVIDVARNIAGVEVNTVKDITTFIFAFKSQDWILTAQVPPKSEDAFIDLPEEWQREVALMYATHFDAELGYDFKKDSPRLTTKKGLYKFLYPINTPLIGEDLLVNTLEISTENNPSAEDVPVSNYTRLDKYIQKADVTDYSQVILGAFKNIHDIAARHGIENRIDILMSFDDETNLFIPEKSIAYYATKLERREDQPLDEGDTLSMLVEGTMVLGIEQGILWLIDILLSGNSLGIADSFRLLNIRSAFREAVKFYTNIELPPFRSIEYTPPQTDTYRFGIQDSEDRWDFSLSRHEDIVTPPSIMTEKDKVDLIVEVLKWFGVDVTKKGVVTYPDGRPLVTLGYDFDTENHTTYLSGVSKEEPSTVIPFPTATGQGVRSNQEAERIAANEAIKIRGAMKASPDLGILQDDSIVDSLFDIPGNKVHAVIKRMIQKVHDQINKTILGDANVEYVKHPNVNGSSVERVVTPQKIDVILDNDVDLITLNGFQSQILATANEKMRWRDQVMNATLGLAGENGEFNAELSVAQSMLNESTARLTEAVKKHFFHDWSDLYHDYPNGYASVREKIGKELFDQMFYHAWLAKLFEFNLGELAQIGRRKLVERHENKPTEGSPDVNDTTESQV